MLVDLNRLITPRLVVMDGIVGMEGNGPRNGDPRQVGVLLVSDDPVAIDALVCRLMALDPALVDTVVYGERWGLGTASDIELLGDGLPVIDDYVVNRNRTSTPGGRMSSVTVKRLVTPRPYVVHERCTRCGTCVQVCPVDPRAVDWPDGDRSRPPVHDYKRCIRCYCCQEMCPERAIEVSTPPLGRLIRR
jgi:ferredoxin